MESGLYAPSGWNQQPWHFTVIQDKSLINQMNAEIKEIAKQSEVERTRKLGENEKFHVFYDAPVAIVVSIEDIAVEGIVDCAAASQNMLLAAESLNIGSVWIGMIRLLFKGDTTKTKAYKERLGIPTGYTPNHVLVFGHKVKENQIAPKRREHTVNYIK